MLFRSQIYNLDEPANHVKSYLLLCPFTNQPKSLTWFLLWILMLKFCRNLQFIKISNKSEKTLDIKKTWKVFMIMFFTYSFIPMIASPIIILTKLWCSYGENILFSSPIKQVFNSQAGETYSIHFITWKNLIDVNVKFWNEL